MTDAHKVIGIADEIMPNWRNKGRKENDVFCRVLLNKELRRLNETLQSIGELTGHNHSTVLYHLKKDVSDRFLTRDQREIKEKWIKAIQPLETKKNKIKKLCEELLSIVGMDCFIINKKSETYIQDEQQTDIII